MTKQSQYFIMPPCNDNYDNEVEGDNRIIGDDIEVKPGLHHATELGVQANQVVCGSRFLIFFSSNMTLSFVNKVFEMCPGLSEQVQNI